MSGEFVLVFRNVQLAAIQPLKAQSNNASLGEINTSFLLVLGSLAQLQLVPVGVEDGRDLPGDILRLVKDRRGLKTRDNFVTKLADPVSLPGFDGPEIFELGWRFHPGFGPAVEDNVLEQMFADTLRLSAPLGGALGHRKPGDALEQILPDLK